MKIMNKSEINKLKKAELVELVLELQGTLASIVNLGIDALEVKEQKPVAKKKVEEQEEPIDNPLYTTRYRSGLSYKEVAWGEGFKKQTTTTITEEQSYKKIDESVIPFDTEKDDCKETYKEMCERLNISYNALEDEDVPF